MTSTQVLMWFFKEQKSMLLLKKAFNEIQTNNQKRLARNIFLANKAIETFDTYVNYLERNYGMCRLIEYIQYECLSAIRNQMGYKYSIEACKKMEDEFAPLMKKWRYFISHNLFTNSIKAGDKLYFDWYNNGTFGLKEITINEVQLGRGIIKGRTNIYNKDMDYHLWMNSLKGKDGKPIEFDFYIKRRGGVYYGANNK
jgi:hypothetical protein